MNEELDNTSDQELDQAIFSYVSYFKGTRLFAIADYERAIEEFRKILSKDPSDHEAHRMLALSLARAGRARAAEHEARTAVSLAPDEAASYHTLGSVLEENGRTYEAREALMKAAEMAPENIIFLNSLAELENTRDEPIRAEVLSRRALELDPVDTWARVNLAVSFQKQRKYDEALQIYLEELRDKPDNPALRNNIGVIYLELNKPDEAQEHFRAALRVEPGMRDAKRNLIASTRMRGLLYGMFWRYYVFINRFSFWVKIAIFTAVWMIIGILDTYAKHAGRYAEFIQPLMIIYFAAILSIWIVPVILNALIDAGWIE